MKNRYRCNPIEIDHKRWDPLSAGSSTLIDTMIDLTSNGKNMFVNPYREIKKAQTLRRETSSLEATQSSGLRGGGSLQRIHNPTGAAAAAGVATKELGKMSGGFAKGMLLDLPVAMADGFHNLPVLYGDKKMERGEVKDWKSGMLVGGKVSESTKDLERCANSIIFRHWQLGSQRDLPVLLSILPRALSKMELLVLREGSSLERWGFCSNLVLVGISIPVEIIANTRSSNVGFRWISAVGCI